MKARMYLELNLVEHGTIQHDTVRHDELVVPCRSRDPGTAR